MYNGYVDSIFPTLQDTSWSHLVYLEALV
jgi:hypothetical protein